MTVIGKALLGAILVGGSLALAGCKTTNIATGPNCASANWYDVGFGDGSNGLRFEAVEQYRSCSAFNRPEPFNAYRAGWREGIGRYCTEESGFGVGVNGASYDQSCPQEIEGSFKRGRKLGDKIFKVNQKITDKEVKIEILEKDLRRGRYSAQQRSVLERERSELIRKMGKNQKRLSKLTRTAQKRGFLSY